MKDKNSFRDQLQELKKQAEEKLEKTQAHIRHSGGPVSKSFDEQATETLNDDVIYNLDNMVKSELAQIEAALAKIASDEYGFCEECGNEIGQDRLKAIPYTPVCKTCALKIMHQQDG